VLNLTRERIRQLTASILERVSERVFGTEGRPFMTLTERHPDME